MYISFLVTSSFLGELPGQVLSFAANTIYMAITCSNHRPVAENDEESDAKAPSKGKRKTYIHTYIHRRHTHATRVVIYEQHPSRKRMNLYWRSGGLWLRFWVTDRAAVPKNLTVVLVVLWC